MPGGPAKSAAKAKPRQRQAQDGDAPEKPASTTARVAWRRACRDVMRTVAGVIDNGVRAFHVVMKIIGPCFICLALGLISFVTHTYFTVILPTVEEEWGSAGQIGFTVLGLWLVSNLVYNYGKSIVTDPGMPPEFDEAINNQEAEELNQPPPKQCKHCSRLKPARAHHCSVCRRCVLKMDHHCPWINNCVGFGNYRHFCLFLLFLASSCVFVMCVFWRQFSNGMFGVRHRPRLPRGSRQAIMTSFMISCSILIALAILGGFHVYLVLTNQTTIEFQLNLLHRREARRNGEYFRNPYDMGRRRNFQQVFGPNAFCGFRWLMPYFAAPPVGDGLNFASISGVKI